MDDINIRFAGTEYIIGDKILEVYTQGCSVKCPGCHNSELWDFNGGSEFPRVDLEDKIKWFSNMIDKIFIVGGEPLQQPVDEVVKMIEFFKSFNKEVWLFTSFGITKVPGKVANICDYIKTGKFNPAAGDGKEHYGVKLSTANQKIYKNGVDYDQNYAYVKNIVWP